MGISWEISGFFPKAHTVMKETQAVRTDNSSLESAFEKDPQLDEIQGYVEDSGEGRWTVQQAIDTGVSATAIAHALFKRFQSRQADVFSDKVLAALRNEFGGHAVASAGDAAKASGAGAGGVEAARADKR